MKGFVLVLLCLLIVRVIAQEPYPPETPTVGAAVITEVPPLETATQPPTPSPDAPTPTDAPPEPSATHDTPPTEILPTETPPPSLTPIDTAIPPTDSPTEPAPSAEPTATATNSPTPTSIAPISFETTFEGGTIPADWQFTGLWTVVQTESGHALQADLNGGTLSFAALPHPFYIEVDLWLQTGSITIQTHETNPITTLTPQQLSIRGCALEEATVSLTGWHTLRVVWMEQGVSASIGETTLNQPCDLTSDPDERVQLVVNAGLLRIRRVQLAAGSPTFPTLQVEPAPPPTAIPPIETPTTLPYIVSSAAQPLSASAPPAPIPTYPLNGTLIGGNIEMPLWVGNVIFNWTMPTGSSATSYLFELSSHPAFQTISEVEPMPMQPDTALDLNMIAPNPISDGRYYWRVRALNAAGSSPWSTPQTIQIDRTPPPAVTLQLPAAAPVVSQNTRPTFSWSSAAGAVRYRLLVSYLPDLSVPVEGYESRIISGLSFTGSGMLGHPNYVAPLQGEFFWAVYPIDAAGNIGSAVIRDSYVDFRRSPAADALLLSAPAGIRPRLDWMPVIGMTTYSLDLANNPFFDGGITHTLEANHYTITRFDVEALYPLMGDVLRPGAVIFWRVRLPNQPSGYTPPRAFFVVDGALSAPRISTPADRAHFNQAPSFLVESPLLSLASSRVDVEIQVSPSLQFPPHATLITIGLYDANPIPLIQDLPSSAGTTYFWRARFIYHTASREITSPFSAPRSFVYDTQPPVFVPIPTVRAQNLRPALSFPAATGAVRYTVSQLQGSAPVVISPTPLTVPRFTPITDLKIGQNVLTVRAFDAAGNSADATFTVQVDIAQSPTPSASVRSPVTFRWANQPGHTQYTFQIATDPTFTELHPNSTTINGSAHTVTLQPGVFYWRVFPTGAALSDDLPSRALYVSASPLSRATLGLVAADNTLNIAEHAAGNALLSCQGAQPEHAPMLHAVPYQVELAANAAFTQSVQRVPVVCDGQPHAQLPAGELVSRPFVRVLTTYHDGLVLISPAQRITVDLTPPSVPVPLYPSAALRITTPLPTLRWQASAGVRPRDGYRVEFFEPTHADPFRVVSASAPELATSRLPVSTFAPLPQSSIEWRVVAVDPAGNESASPRLPFTIHLGSSPAHDAYLSTTLPQFVFERYPWHTGTYQVIIASDSTFHTLHSQHEIACTSTPCRFTLPSGSALSRGADYYWIVLPSTLPFDLAAVGAAAHFYVLAEADLISAPTLELVESDADQLLNAAQASDGLTFAWQAPAGLVSVQVVGYELQISRSITFHPLTAAHQTTDAAPSAALPVTWPDGKYFWRVRALLDRGGHSPYSAVGTFTLDRTPPTAPILTFPLGGTLTTTQPRLTWRPSPSAITYEGTINGVPFTTVNTHYTATLTQGQHTLTLRAVDQAGNLSAASQTTWAINLSQLPPHRAVRQQTSATLPIEFAWAVPTGYSGSYTLYLDTDGDFTTVDSAEGQPLTPITTTANRVRLPHLPEGIYRWWVGVGDEPLPDSLTPFTFAQTRAGVPAPLLNALAGDDRLNAAEYPDAAFTWNAPLGAAWQPVSYTFELSNSSTFSRMLHRTTSSTPAFSASALAVVDGTYFWRVRALYPYGFERVSPPRTIVIDRAGPPSAPQLISPLAHWVFAGTQPSFSWSSPPTSAYFRLDILTEDGASLVRSYIVTSPRLSVPTSAPLPAGTYLWRVQAYDNVGNTSPLSATRRVRVTN